MLIAVVVLLGLLAATFAALYWRGLREARSLSEYAQHLLLEPESYADHRGKLRAYSRTHRQALRQPPALPAVPLLRLRSRRSEFY